MKLHYNIQNINDSGENFNHSCNIYVQLLTSDLTSYQAKK